MDQDIEAYRRRGEAFYRFVRDMAYWVSVLGVLLTSVFAATVALDHLLSTVEGTADTVSQRCFTTRYSRIFPSSSIAVCDFSLNPTAAALGTRQIEVRTRPSRVTMTRIASVEEVRTTPLLRLPYSMKTPDGERIQARWGLQLVEMAIRIAFILFFALVRSGTLLSRGVRKDGDIPESPIHRSLLFSLMILLAVSSLFGEFPLYGGERSGPFF
ncbi:MAG: hypothetical protein AAGI52_03850 [Bacteroidota bacterium]